MSTVRLIRMFTYNKGSKLTVRATEKRTGNAIVATTIETTRATQLQATTKRPTRESRKKEGDMEVSRRSFLAGAAAGTAGIIAGTAITSANIAHAESAPDTAPATTGGDGTYSATAKGLGGDVTVTLTIENSALTDVTAEGPNETQGIGSRALESMPPDMLSKNSVEVDGVSGATVTSNAILQAAADALAQSGVTLQAVETAPVAQAMTPGVYYGEEFGKWKKGTIEGERFGSPHIIEPTRVAVEVDETKILSVTVESCSDTPGFIEPCIERIPAAIVEAQSVNVDCVTGATMTSQAIIAGVEQALTEAGADLSGFRSAPVRVEASEEYECDFAIVSAGGAGTVAAMRAVEAGLSVVIIEKCGKVGGESVCSTGILAPGAEWLNKAHAEDGVEVPDANYMFTELSEYAKYRCDTNVLYNVVNHMGPVADYLADHFDRSAAKEARFDGFVPSINGCSMDWGKGTTKFDVLYDDYILPGGAKLLLETRAYELIQNEDGTVTGVKARKQDGTEVTVKAPYTLVACGGFGGNRDLMREYLRTDNLYLYGVSSNTGDGLQMALAAGGRLTTEINPLPAEFCSNLKVDFYAGYMKFINYAGLLQVNPEGQRFYNEELGATEPLGVGTSALYAIDHAYAIFCQADLDAMVAEGCPGLLSEEVRETLRIYRSRACVPFYTLADEMQAAIEAGEGWSADTLEELGEKIGFDPDVWSNTIDDYLAAIEAGEDAQFHKRPEMLRPLSEGPFYAVRFCMAIDGTLNGVRANQYFQALNENLKPIPGLFLGGLDAGGMWGNVYYASQHCAGVSQGHSVTSGYIAAEKVIELLGA